MDVASAAWDVFISYHWKDRDAVEIVARDLRAAELKVFLDRWYLVPGGLWPEVLERTLRTCRAVVVFIGRDGLGPWQQRERYLALDRQAGEPAFRVIPVLLPGADPALGFLQLNTWIDFRNGRDPAGTSALVEAINGRPPGPDPAGVASEASISVCPYRGLKPFREEDAPFFFGRGTYVDRIASLLERRSLTALIGVSGSGKSSVARAGLVPHLRTSPSGQVWEIATLVPNDRPMHALAATLMPLLDSKESEVDRLSEIGKLAASLSSGGIRVRDVVRRILERQPGTDRLLLLVDQWEELYTLVEDAGERHRFIAELLDATREGPVSAVFTLRADFFGHVLADRPLADRLQDAVVMLGPMTNAELESAIVEPARKVRLEFESGLAERIVDGVERAPGQLPLLEFALTELWSRRRGGQLLHRAYEDIGEVSGAVAQWAERVYQRLTEEQRLIARRVFMNLVRVARPDDASEDTRQRVDLQSLGVTALPIVRSLADERLLVTGRNEATGADTVEVVHEALIRGWSGLRQWIDQDRAGLLMRRELTEAAQRWNERGTDEAYLFKATQLETVDAWAARHCDELTAPERAFLVHSAIASSCNLAAWVGRYGPLDEQLRLAATFDREGSEVESRRRGIAVLEAIGRASPESVIPRLTRIVASDPSRRTRRAAVRSLVRLGAWPALVEAIASASGDERAHFLEGVGYARNQAGMLADVDARVTRKNRTRVRVYSIYQLISVYRLVFAIGFAVPAIASFLTSGIIDWLGGILAIVSRPVLGVYAEIVSGSSQSGDAAGLLAIFATYGLLRERLSGVALSRRRCLALGALAGLTQSLLAITGALLFGASQTVTGEVKASQVLLLIVARALDVVPMALLGLFLRDLRQPRRRWIRYAGRVAAAVWLQQLVVLPTVLALEGSSGLTLTPIVLSLLHSTFFRAAYWVAGMIAFEWALRFATNSRSDEPMSTVVDRLTASQGS